MFIMNRIEDIYPIMRETLDRGNTFTFPVKGTSMQPLLHTNDSVTLKSFVSYKKGDIVFFIRDNGQFVLHRIKKVKKDIYLIVGDHQTVLEEVPQKYVIAKVIAYKKRGKEKVNNLKGLRYKTYSLMCRLKLFRWFNAHFRWEIKNIV